MTKHYRVRPALAVAIAALTFATACPSRTPSPRPASKGTPAERGGTLRVLFAEDPDSLDPNRAASPASWFVARAVHRGLMAFPDLPYPEGAQPVPDLAGAPNVDGLVYEFNLRSGVRFAPPLSRGVNASDVVASIARAKASRVGIASALADVAAIKAKDPRTVVIRLKRARTDFLSILAHPQAAIVPAGSKPRTTGVEIAGAGPYSIEEYHPEAGLRLVRNRNWGNDDVRAANVETIVATFGVDAAKANATVARGDADLIADPGPPDVTAPRPPKGATTTTVSTGCVRYLFLDPRATPLDNVYARRAIANATQRAKLPAGVRATGMLPPFVEGSNDLAALPEDATAARNNLGRARQKKGFGVTMIVEDSPRDRAESAAIAGSLRRVGIRANVVRMSPPDLVSTYADARNVVPMGLATWCADWPGNAGWNVLANTTSRSRMRSLPAILKRALSGKDVAGEWARADRLVCATATVIPLAWTTTTSVLSPSLRGFVGSPAWPRGDPANVWLAR